ncbi:MAG TPA: DNA-binding response regulator [Bacteroidales bacterium]|nr:MAG: hypothetical protein A2W98_13890 [Bacteroidetes bacterium GWF2_33_38]OFY73966.1 MAG: hypothetical protein A2265_09435 [Bacteroidetes bacterium RIFOXYA12_FULL_33_9]OFY91232.1 MAG: hypothetical protein A2236_08655 [Bacteroidetes bacterium RIFOXYA2_FULL_33_7]HBF89216.1 DNA-binding response regulator [Bacteroidales bacterium]
MIRAIIIDDEKAGRETLKNFISKYCDGINVVAEGESVKSGIKVILEHSPDLVFLDIQMHDGTGFDLLEMLPQINFKLIFVTSHDQFAIRAFKYSAIDYLLKPVDPDQLLAAIKRILDKNVIFEIQKKLDVLLSNKIEIKKIALSTFDGIRFIKIEDIIRCESDNNYTMFFLKNKEKILVSKTLKDFETMLSELSFFRVHKSHLINIQYISRFVPDDGGYLIMEDNSKIEVSRRKKDGLLSILMK